MAMMERLSDNPDYGLPDPGPLSRIITWFIELGEVAHGPGGVAIFSWQEIDAWSKLTGLDISPRESLALRYLSTAYINEFYRSNNCDCASPNIAEPDRRERVDGRLKRAFEAMRK